MNECRETTGEDEKLGNCLKGAQRAQLRGSYRGSCKLKVESRERAKSYYTEQLREPLGSLGDQMKS